MHYDADADADADVIAFITSVCMHAYHTYIWHPRPLVLTQHPRSKQRHNTQDNAGQTHQTRVHGGDTMEYIQITASGKKLQKANIIWGQNDIYSLGIQQSTGFPLRFSRKWDLSPFSGHETNEHCNFPSSELSEAFQGCSAVFCDSNSNKTN